MSNSYPCPRFVFRIDTLQETEIRTWSAGSGYLWMPSCKPGHNRLIGGGISGSYWQCTGQQMLPLAAGLPEGCHLYKTFSVYFCEAFGFWVLNGDAAEPPAEDTWRRLRFDHDDNIGYSSYLTNAGQHATLRTQRSDQGWPHKLLPDIYHAPPISQTADTRYGGLTGDLPIFLALLVFSIAPDYVPWMLQNCFANGRWTIHQYPHGRMHKRGVVVRVWTCPGSTAQDLEQLEQGQTAKYFY